MKYKNMRITVTKPDGEIAFDGIIKRGQNVDVSFAVSMTHTALDAMLGEKKKKVFYRRYKFRIQKLKG
jgi:hypothetical protein